MAVSPLDIVPLCSGTSDQMHDSPLSTELFDPPSALVFAPSCKVIRVLLLSTSGTCCDFSLGCMIFLFQASVPELIILKNCFNVNVFCFVPSVAKCLLNNDCEQKKVLL